MRNPSFVRFATVTSMLICAAPAFATPSGIPVWSTACHGNTTASCNEFHGSFANITYKFHEIVKMDQGHKVCDVTISYTGVGQLHPNTGVGARMGTIVVDEAPSTVTCTTTYPGKASTSTTNSTSVLVELALGPEKQGGGLVTGSGYLTLPGPFMLMPPSLIGTSMSYTCATSACLDPAPAGAKVTASFHGIVATANWKPQVDLDFQAKFNL